jgi:hypothetical protein
MSDQKIFLIEAKCEDYYEGDCNPVLSVRETDILELVKLHSYQLGSAQLIQELLKNPVFVAQLEAQGFQDIKKIKQVADNIVYGTKFMVDQPSQAHYLRGTVVDLKDLPHYGASLANEKVTLLHVVDKACIEKLSPETHKAMVAQLKRNRSLNAKKAVNSKQREEKKKQRKIEKAKKMLMEAGVKVEV